MANESTPRAMKPAEVARELQISLVTVNRLVERGVLRGVHLGKVLRIERASVEALFDEEQTG